MAFMACPLFEVLLEGNRGGGKTDVLLMDYAKEIGQGWGREWKGLLLRRTYPELSDVIEKSQKWFPQMFPGCNYNISTHTWVFLGGEKLTFAFAAQPKDYYAYHGKSFTWIGWEELTTWPDDSLYRRFMSLVRSSCVGIPRRVRSTTNPFGVGHNWVKSRFKLPQMRGRVITDDETKRKRVAIFCDLRNNQALLAADPDYIGTIREAADSPALQAAWLNGSWDIVSGGMFSDIWDGEIHILPGPINVPPGWYMDRAYDDGSARPFSVGWWAESNGSDLILPGGRVMRTVRGDIIRFAEWYGWSGKKRDEGIGLSAAEVTRGIITRELEMGIYGRVSDGPADSQIFAMTHGVSVANDMMLPVEIEGKLYPGLRWQPSDKGPGSRIGGWRQIRGMLKQALPGPKGRREKPGLFVADSCEEWINTVPILGRDDKNQDDVPDNVEDHCADETRYRCHNPPRRLVVRPTVGLY